MRSPGPGILPISIGIVRILPILTPATGRCWIRNPTSPPYGCGKLTTKEEVLIQTPGQAQESQEQRMVSSEGVYQRPTWRMGWRAWPGGRRGK